MFASFMVNTWIAGTVVAVMAGVVGFFVVLRGESFAAHAIPNGAFAGAAGASLVGLNELVGLAGASVVAALGISWLARRGRRDVATALVLVLLLALGAAFLSRTTEYGPELVALLFGQLFGVSTTELVPVTALAAVCLLAVSTLYRPLLYASSAPEIASARRVPIGLLGVGFLVVVALATAMTVPVVGALLIFSLLIGPPAAARAVLPRPGPAIALSVVLAVLTVWLSIAGSFETNWPVGFFVGTASAAWYLLGRLAGPTLDRVGRRMARVEHPRVGVGDDDGLGHLVTEPQRGP